jgi:hypothetical protein
MDWKEDLAYKRANKALIEVSLSKSLGHFTKENTFILDEQNDL